MSDDTRKRGEPDRSLISLTEGHEVRYWTKALNATEKQLRSAVDAVGNGAGAVRSYLEQGGRT